MHVINTDFAAVLNPHPRYLPSFLPLSSAYSFPQPWRWLLRERCTLHRTRMARWNDKREQRNRHVWKIYHDRKSGYNPTKYWVSKDSSTYIFRLIAVQFAGASLWPYDWVDFMMGQPRPDEANVKSQAFGPSKFRLCRRKRHLRYTRPGKPTKNYGKSPCLMGKSTINGHVQ